MNVPPELRIGNESRPALFSFKKGLSRPVIALRKPRGLVWWEKLGSEPYRLFFPLACLAGGMGVLLWPLHFAGVYANYPGQVHARCMTAGLFGGFIFGFLGTALPRMLSARPLGIRNVLALGGLYVVMMGAFLSGSLFYGELFFGLSLTFLISLMGVRAVKRRDLPPPGFMLVLLAFGCALGGNALAIGQQVVEETDLFWVVLQRLLSYQGFVLLPILGIGPFILPRLLGVNSTHDFPEALVPPRGWVKQAVLALACGGAVVWSFVVEALGRVELGHVIRFGAACAYVTLQFPFKGVPAARTIGMCLRFAFVSLLAGYMLVALFPAYRVGFLHATFIGGFAVITFVIATRVVFGHSGNLSLMEGRNRWLIGAVGLMFVAMITRMSGDIWPNIMASHYVYSACIWTAGMGLWALRVLPKVLDE